MKLFLLVILSCLLEVKSDPNEDVEIFLDYRFLNFDLNFKLKTNSQNELCNNQLKYFQDSLDRNVLWARKMRDAWGNVPSGIFSGNRFDFGNFDQCIKFSHASENVGEFSGQHCTILIPFNREEQTQMARINTFSKS